MVTRIRAVLVALAVMTAATSARADVVLTWNELTVKTLISQGQNGFAQARFAAIVQLAVFEAVNAITGDYQPYIGIAAPAGASPEAAAATAAYRMLKTYFPLAPDIDLAYANSLAGIPDGPPKTDGILTGEAAAAALIPLATALASDQADDPLTAAASGGSSDPRQPQPSVAATVLSVADVEQLYAAMNDPANEGAAITLAPGTYVLSVNDAAGDARANGGRLELQRDMSLYGVTGDRSAVVIDATGLPASSFGVPFGRTAPVRIGRGSNTIEWLTVQGNPAAAAGIATELPGTASTWIRVAHVISGGSSRGVDVRNVGAANAGRRIDAEIVDNEFFGPTQVIGMAEGIRVANFVGANGGVIVATLSGNRIHGFQLGCIVANNQSSNALVQVRSSGDRFFANALACLIAGGLSTSTTTGVANSNSTIFEAHGSQFVDNTAPIPGVAPGGILVVGGRSTIQPNLTSYNTVSVALWGSKVSGNLGVNFEAFGALEDALSGIAGTNNHVTIALHGVSKQIDVSATASLPVDPTGTNTVTVIR